MKKMFAFFLLIFFCSFVTADEGLPGLKDNHDAMIQKTGDVSFLEGTHYFTYSNNRPFSVYVIQGQKSVYMEQNDCQLYRIICANRGNAKLDVSFTDKININQNSYTLKYSISFLVSEKAGGYFVALDENKSVIQDQASWAKILSNLSKYAQEVFETLEPCAKCSDTTEDLRIIGPDLDISREIFGELPATIQSPEDTIQYQTIGFSWSWNFRTGFQAPPVYREMPYTIVGFDSVVARGTNAWGIVVEGSTTGSNIAKVVLARVSYMAYPQFWSSTVQGTIRCVMQR